MRGCNLPGFSQQTRRGTFEVLPYRLTSGRLCGQSVQKATVVQSFAEVARPLGDLSCVKAFKSISASKGFLGQSRLPRCLSMTTVITTMSSAIMARRPIIRPLKPNAPELEDSVRAAIGLLSVALPALLPLGVPLGVPPEVLAVGLVGLWVEVGFARLLGLTAGLVGASLKSLSP